MYKATVIKLTIATIVTASVTLIATNPLDCYDAIPTGLCYSGGTWVQTITCQVNCISCPWTARDNQICLRTTTRTNQIFASTQHNWSCTNGSSYLICKTTSFNGCQYEREKLVCPAWPTTQCLPTLTREWVTGPRIGVETPQLCPKSQ